MERRKVARGEKLYRAFNGKSPVKVDRVRLREYETLVKIGPCTHIAYIAEDGKNYMHKFKYNSRPTLAVSDDGKQLYLLLGRYRFTGRGITDI